MVLINLLLMRGIEKVNTYINLQINNKKILVPEESLSSFTLALNFVMEHVQLSLQKCQKNAQRSKINQINSSSTMGRSVR